MLFCSLPFLFVFLSCFSQGTAAEPSYVTELRKFFEDPSFTGVYYRQLQTVKDLETVARDVFRTFLKDKKYTDIERYFDEWERTYSNNGPFESEEQRSELSKEITTPRHFQTSLQIENLLTNRDDAEEATRAYKEAFVSRDEAKVVIFYLGDGDIMHGVLIAGVRNVDATFIVQLMD